MAKIMDSYNLRNSIKKFAESGKAIWGTCAGMILMASELTEDRPKPLGLIDITVQRNGFGRQINSFETDVYINGLDGGALHVFFIRAPQILHIGEQVQVISSLADGAIIGVRQGNLLATSFHPELSEDSRMHKYFLELCINQERLR